MAAARQHRLGEGQSLGAEYISGTQGMAEAWQLHRVIGDLHADQLATLGQAQVFYRPELVDRKMACRVRRIGHRIGQFHLAGIRIGTCVPAVCELEAGFPLGDRGDNFRRALRRLLGRVRLWPVELEISPPYGDLFKQLRDRGRFFCRWT